MSQKLYLASQRNLSVVEDTLGEDGPYSGFREIRGEAYYTAVYINSFSFCDDYISPTETFEVGDEVYVVYAHYYDGGTFGVEDGYLNCVLITKDEQKAQDALTWIKYTNDLYNFKHRKYTQTVEPKYVPAPEGHTEPKNVEYQAWTGYFTGLKDAMCTKMVII